ncbi:hypothetical protein LUZ60_010381 [Juncus effusus]|nr:hypothetical protein LUZ60_010381 [Juncus effusus]
MADSTSKAAGTNAAAAAEHRRLAVDPPLHSPPPQHGPKEKPPSTDTEVPLSPQWLLPKTGDKNGTKEANPNPDEPNSVKKPFRPSSMQQHQTDTKWRDDERETLRPAGAKWTKDPNKDAPPSGTKWTPSWRTKDEPRDPRPEKEGEKEKDARPWKPSSGGRGKGEAMDPALGPPRTKTFQFGYGRGGGRGENGNSNPGYRGGRYGNSNPGFRAGVLSDRPTDGGPEYVRYSRMKLLDVYRNTDLKNFKLSNGEIPKMSFVQEEPSEPFALSALTGEESVIMKGIDKGDIIGVYQQKEQHKEEMPLWMEDDNDGNNNNKNNLRQFSFHENPPNSEEPGLLDRSSSMKRQESLLSPNSSKDPLFSRRMQNSHIAPEDLSLLYKDPHGQIQGPFSGADIMGWYEAGYFGIDLLVRLDSVPADTPFCQLGEMMPHLKAKARPPPGFGGAALQETGTVGTVGKGPVVEEQNRFLESLMAGKLGGPSAGNVGTKAELNYLLAQKQLVERQKSFNANQYNTVPVPAGTVPQKPDLTPNINNNNNNNTSSIFSKLLPPNNNTNISINNTNPSVPSVFSKLLPPMETQPQKVDLLQMLHSAESKPQQQIPVPVQSNLPVPVQMPVPGMNFPLWGNLHEAQNPNLQQNPNPQIGLVQPRLMNQLNPQMNPNQNPLLSEISQDPQILGLLQQQYLMQQQQQATQMAAQPSQQLSLMDKFLLLKQQQQQQLLMQKQQEMLSHAAWQAGAPNPSAAFPGIQNPGIHSPGIQNPGMQVEARQMNLPHQMFDNIPVQVPVPNKWETPLIPVSSQIGENINNKPEQINDQVLLPPNNNNEIKSEDFFWGSSDLSADVTARVSDIRILDENCENAPAEKEIKSEAKKLTSEKKSKNDDNAPEPETKTVTKTSEKKSKKQKKKKNGTETESTTRQNDEKSESSLPPAKALEREFDDETEREITESASEINQAGNSKLGWKQTPGLRPKSLKEIQAEEQMRAKRNPMPAGGTVQTPEASVPVLQKSPLHDVLAEEVLAKSNELERDPILVTETGTFSEFMTLPPQSPVPVPVDDDDFIEAKDSKKNRKKSKGKNSKAAVSVSSSPQVDVPVEKNNKPSKVVSQQEASLPAPPAGPSLGDFIWKGDSVNSSAQSVPAWSNDSKLQKTLSLREIQREQERKAAALGGYSVPAPVQMPAQTVPVPSKTRGNGGSSSSWQVSPSNKSPVPVPVQNTGTKGRNDDDFFWGPLDSSKQDSSKQSEFPSLGKGGKREEPVLSRQKSAKSPQPVSKGRVDDSSKLAEAIDFRSWCEGEWARLTGTNDTSFLEYCIKQSPNEAEMLLRENLGNLDVNHAFTDKFLNFKSFLSPDVLELAFSPNLPARAASGSGAVRTGMAVRDLDAELAGKGKKGKKGKKVSAAVLGFNVVSNRIMMGEIQNPE